MFRLDGKVALITGAAGEIGSAVARLFRSQGASLALVDVNQQGVLALAEELSEAAMACQADVSTAGGCRRAVDAAVERFQRLDVLVNNAGICPRIPFLKSTEEDWDRIVAVNQKSMYFCSQAAAPHLRRTKGRIISVASYAGRAGAAANASIYSGTKGAIIAMTKAIARELAPDVTVNAVAPGAIDSAMVNVLAPDRLQALLQTIPLQRLGTVDEVAKAILFLATEGSYMTGATIDANGGWMML
ncbi:MAG: SDR family oxidoreductase [Acidobacteria bacterium]|nr:SDR family oxidoreductase [Acidobacteriota bacterium]